MHTTDSTDPAEAKRKAHKAQQAVTYSNLQTLLEEGENLMGFTRGKIAGGVQGKLFMGLESFFVPDVNIGLTDKRVIFQHLGRESDKPSRVAPHSFPLSEIINIQYLEADAFHESNELGRLVIQLVEEQSCRMRLYGQGNCDSSRELVEVFSSLTSGRHSSSASPVQNTCAECKSILDHPAKFCPYCGVVLPVPEAPAPSEESAAETAVEAESVVEVSVEIAAEAAEVVEAEVETDIEAIVDAVLEPITEAEVEPVEMVDHVLVDATEPLKETPLEPVGTSDTPSPSDEIKSWDSYAQKVMHDKNTLNVEGEKA